MGGEVSRRDALVVAAGVLLVVGGLYGRTLGFDYVWDDHQLIQHNPQVTQPGSVAAPWSSHLMAGGQPGSSSRFYRPLVIASYQLDWRLYGAPWGFHLTNVLLHALGAVLVLLLALRLGAGLLASTAAGLLVAVWAVPTEPVAWIAGRSDLLMAVGVALACLCVATLVTEAQRALRWPLVITPIALAFGLLAKETALVAVPALALAVLVRHRALGWRRVLAALLGLVIPVGAALALRHNALGNLALTPDPTADPSGGAWLARLGVQLKLLLGFDLRALVAIPEPGAGRFVAQVAGVTATGGVVVGGAALLLTGGGSRPQRAVTGALLLVAAAALLASASSRIPALRYGYLPGLLLAPALALALARLRPVLRPAVVITGCSFIAAGWVGLGQLRLDAWRSDGALFAMEVAQSPGNPDAQYLYGDLLLSRGQAQRAAKHFKHALALQRGHRPSWLGLSRALLQAGKPAAAERVIRTSLQGKPHTAPQFTLLGHALARQGQLGPALAAYSRALALAPRSVQALAAAARVARGLGDTARAAELERRQRELSGGTPPSGAAGSRQ